jgi:hypothetical protein
MMNIFSLLGNNTKISEKITRNRLRSVCQINPNIDPVLRLNNIHRLANDFKKLGINIPTQGHNGQPLTPEQICSNVSSVIPNIEQACMFNPSAGTESQSRDRILQIIRHLANIFGIVVPIAGRTLPAICDDLYAAADQITTSLESETGRTLHKIQKEIDAAKVLHDTLSGLTKKKLGTLSAVSTASIGPVQQVSAYMNELKSKVVETENTLKSNLDMLRTVKITGGGGNGIVDKVKEMYKSIRNGAAPNMEDDSVREQIGKVVNSAGRMSACMAILDQADIDVKNVQFTFDDIRKKILERIEELLTAKNGLNDKSIATIKSLKLALDTSGPCYLSEASNNNNSPEFIDYTNIVGQDGKGVWTTLAGDKELREDALMLFNSIHYPATSIAKITDTIINVQYGGGTMAENLRVASNKYSEYMTAISLLFQRAAGIAFSLTPDGEWELNCIDYKCNPERFKDVMNLKVKGVTVAKMANEIAVLVVNEVEKAEKSGQFNDNDLKDVIVALDDIIKDVNLLNLPQ